MFQVFTRDTGYMSEQQVENGMQRLARLVREELSERNMTPQRLADLFDMSGRSVENWLAETKVPQRMKRGQIEHGLKWQQGIISKLLDEDVWPTKAWTLDDVRIPDPSQQPVARASQLTDDELLTEVTCRFKTYANKATETPARSQEHFGLAAHHDPTETKTPKRRRPPKT